MLAKLILSDSPGKPLLLNLRLRRGHPLGAPRKNPYGHGKAAQQIKEAIYG
jgi:hypothetical protein